jgi:hypothetical protein
VHTVIGEVTLDNMMGSLGITQVKKCSPLSLIHRFGAHGTPIESDFGVIIPWRVKHSSGDILSFNFRVDVLDGNHPFLIGCPMLVSIKASLDFGELALTANINGVQCTMGLTKRGNHIYLKKYGRHPPKSPLSPETYDCMKFHTTAKILMSMRSIFSNWTIANREPDPATQKCGTC